jgi:hypothetical protein
MSYDKKYLPKLEEFKKLHEEQGDRLILNTMKYDNFVGPKETLDYLIEEYLKIKDRNINPKIK